MKELVKDARAYLALSPGEKVAFCFARARELEGKKWTKENKCYVKPPS